MSLPANMTYDDIYDVLDELDDTDNGGFKGTEIADFIERLSSEVEGKEILSKAYKEHKIEIMKLKQEISTLSGQYELAIQDIKQGEEENKKLKEEIAHKNNKFSEWIEENKKLKEECDKRGHCEEVVETYEKGILKRNNEIKELKEENEKLQEELLMAINTDDIAEIAGEDKEYYRDVCCAHTLGNMILENKKLKEENKILKEQKSDE